MMRKLFLGLTFCLCTMAFFGQGAKVEQLFSNGNTKALAQMFADPIDLTILGKTNLVSKTQAEGMLQEFFNNHTPVNFIPRHHGDKGSPRKFGVGRLVTKQGAFRVSYVMDKNSKTPLIKQIRIHPAQAKP